MDNHWSKSAADLRIFEQAGEILGQTWDNYNRPTFVDIIQNFDAFGDMGFDLLTVKIASNGQMSEHWDRLSGEEIRDGTWKEISPGEWENEKGWITLWDEDDEKESLAWNSRKEVSAALDNSSQGFRDSLLFSLTRLTERVEILHKGEIQFTSSIFTEFEIVTFLCYNTFSDSDPRREEAGKLGIRILAAKHPRHPVGGNPTARDTSGSSTLSKYYDEHYCMFRKNVLQLCYRIVPDAELSAAIGLEVDELESFVNRANEWSCWTAGDRKNNKIGREVREILGVSVKCNTCGKFLPNPRHTHCRKHYSEGED
tara:strand:- start:68 stop:1003 length:936 start_codon:yes stop_codon:yes gene_type:complete